MGQDDQSGCTDLVLEPIDEDIHYFLLRSRGNRGAGIRQILGRGKQRRSRHAVV